jgi:hypothetical protein
MPGQREKMAHSNLPDQFDEEMLNIYVRARSEAGYNASRFLQMLEEHHGVRTAKILLHADKESEGYTALWQRGRLDLTVEAVIYDNPKWQSLFTAEEIETCKRRLTKYGYF